MKVEQKEKGFSPITLTIESQEELDLLSDLFSLVDGVFEDNFLSDMVRDASHSLYKLGASPDFTYINGRLREALFKQ